VQRLLVYIPAGVASMFYKLSLPVQLWLCKPELHGYFSKSGKVESDRFHPSCNPTESLSRRKCILKYTPLKYGSNYGIESAPRKRVNFSFKKNRTFTSYAWFSYQFIIALFLISP